MDSSRTKFNFNFLNTNFMKEINELKAKAYDIIGNLEYLQNELKKTNEEIAKKIQEYNEALKRVDDGEQFEPVN